MTSMSGQPAAVLLRHSLTGAFRVPEVSGYAKEDQLQRILFKHPELVPGVTAPAVACREFQSGAGPADVVIVGADGSLVVVECKLASNPQIRREVVGQVLDYASRLWRMPIEEFESRWSERNPTRTQRAETRPPNRLTRPRPPFAQHAPRSSLA
jgi:hypothetical protein